MKSEKHLQFVKDFFRIEVHVVTEWRDQSVYRTKKVGEVAAFSGVWPWRGGTGVLAVRK